MKDFDEQRTTNNLPAGRHGEQRLSSIIESILFVADEPVSVAKISAVTGADKEIITDLIVELSAKYEEENHGFLIKEIAGGYRFYVNPANNKQVEAFISATELKKLTQASLETLAIIAYKQPVSRAQISEIRGVSSDGSVNTLLQYELIEEKGRSSAPGNPILYRTTLKFLESAGISSLKDLANLKDFAPDEETREHILQSLE